MGRNSHPCKSCMWQQKKENYQKIWNKRNTFLAMGHDKKKVGPLTGVEGCITDIVEMYCECCALPRQYADSLEDPYKRQKPQDNNFYLPQSETLDVVEMLVATS